MRRMTRKAGGRMFIGGAAKAVGVDPRTLRYYESIGLLPAAGRTDSGYRLYSERDLEQLRFARKAQAVGLTLAEIREIIEIRTTGRCPCGHVDKIVTRSLEEVEKRLRELRKMRRDLRRILAMPRPRGSGTRPGVICPRIERSGQRRAKKRTAPLHKRGGKH